VYRIERAHFGIKLTFGGVVSAQELKDWLEESRQHLDEMEEGFCVFVDMKTLGPLDKPGQDVMKEGQRLYKSHGMARSVVILSNPVTTLQFKQIAVESGIYEWERYIDASRNEQWEQLGLDWLMHEMDPDSKKEVGSRS
jgi:hypothetical protein